jgi:hypothetical protein
MKYIHETTYNNLFGIDDLMSSIEDQEPADDDYVLYAVHNGKAIWGDMYKFPDGAVRPKCLNDGCNNPVIISRGTLSDPSKRTLRTVCNPCHLASYGKTSLAEGVTEHKKTYCENTDGRLGFTCTTTIIFSGQLELDHIDGDHVNNIPENVQTLCKDCHAVKSWKNGDFKKKRKK